MRRLLTIPTILALFTLASCSYFNSPVTYTPSAPQTATSTPTPNPSTTANPSHIPEQYVSFSPGINIIAKFPMSGANWSPTRNEMLLTYCFNNSNEGNVLLLPAPFLSFTPVGPHESTCNHDFYNGIHTIWTQNGDYILWSGLAVESEFDFNYIMIVNRNGEDRRIVSTGAVRSSYFHGWMDSITLLASSYEGGGNTGGSLINIVTGDTGRFGDWFAGFYSPSQQFIPVNDSFGISNRTFDKVISRALLPASNPEDFLLKTFLLEIPTSLDFGNPSGLRFVNWYPDQNIMLILVWRNGMDLTHDPDIENSLQVWDTLTNKTEILVPGGVAGEFSRDGSMLAFVANHKLILDDDMRVIAEGDEFDRDKLYIMDISTKRIIYSFDSDSNIISSAEPNLESGWDGGDLNSFAWSPTGDSFIHRNLDGNLEIVSILDGSKMAITTSFGDYVNRPQWSFAGTYISLYFPIPIKSPPHHAKYVTAIIRAP